MSSRKAWIRQLYPVTQWPHWIGYVIGLILISIFTALFIYVLPPAFSGRFPVLYYMTTMGIAYFFGEGPALFSLLLSITAFFLFLLHPLGPNLPLIQNSDDLARSLTFLIATLIGSFASLLVRKAQLQNQTLLHLAQTEEDRLRRFFDNMTELVAIDEIVYDEKGNPIDWVFQEINPAFERALKLQRDQILGQSASDFYGTGRAPQVLLEAFSRVMSQRKAIRFETFLEPLDRYFIVSAFPLDNNRFAVISTDITERKQVEEELSEERLRLKAVLDALPVGVLISDGSGKITQTNEIGDRIWGGKMPLSDKISDYGIYQGWWADTGMPIQAEEWALSRALTRGVDFYR